MYLVLFAVGLLVIAAGFLTIGFGIPINAFSLGNTLIVAGTVAVVGGLVVIGLAAAIRQLNRIAEALNGRTVARPAASAAASPAPATAEVVDSLVPPTARIPHPGRAPTPSKPPEAVMPRPPEPHPAAEPRFPAAASEPAGPLDWLRAKPKTMDAPPLAAEPPAGADEAPLAPRPDFSPPIFTRPPVSEPPVEAKPWLRRGSATEPTPRMEPPPRADTVARTTPPAERAKEPEGAKPATKDAGLFDVVWPDARSKPMSAEPVKREPAPAPSRPREEVRSEWRAEPAPERVSILKSGVIDGMAYTLYADGSIEAELPQGTVKFASVDALRAHLEKSA